VRGNEIVYVGDKAGAEAFVGKCTEEIDLERYRGTYKTDHVWVDTLKVTFDSVIENQKAAMLEPYLDIVFAQFLLDDSLRFDGTGYDNAFVVGFRWNIEI
jgi:hypothetical protein